MEKMTKKVRGIINKDQLRPYVIIRTAGERLREGERSERKRQM